MPNMHEIGQGHLIWVFNQMTRIREFARQAHLPRTSRRHARSTHRADGSEASTVGGLSM